MELKINFINNLGNMKNSKKLSLLLLVIVMVVGAVIYKNYFSSMQASVLSEQQAAKVAIEAVISDGRENRLKPECVSANAQEKDVLAINFNIHEVHNALCGGDPDIAPRITSVVVNLETGNVYDQPTQIDAMDQGWRTIQIGEKDYQVTKQLR